MFAYIEQLKNFFALVKRFEGKNHILEPDVAFFRNTLVALRNFCLLFYVIAFSLYSLIIDLIKHLPKEMSFILCHKELLTLAQCFEI